jgi:hypothetical protein
VAILAAEAAPPGLQVTAIKAARLFDGKGDTVVTNGVVKGGRVYRND